MAHTFVSHANASLLCAKPHKASSMQSSDEILEQAARDGTIDITEWPRVLENVLQKLHDIVYNDFPIPSIPLPAPLPPPIDPEVVVSTPPHATSDSETREHDSDFPDADDQQPPVGSQSSTKENDAPIDIAAIKPPVPKFDDLPAPQRNPPAGMDAPPGTLPTDLLSSYQSSARLLQYAFATSPPYTIQRLAELVQRPRRHYRFLPAYLRALDRVVSVSSPVSDFPLPTGPISANGGFLTNGDAHANGLSDHNTLGSDESLGGALLTPIPWLRHNNNNSQPSTQPNDGELHSESTETIQGPNGAGSIETVSVTINGVSSSAHNSSPNTSTPASPTLSEQSDASTNSSTGSVTDAQLREQGAVTQGELLRQEQEAGVVPVAQTASRRHLLGSGAVALGRDEPSSSEGADGKDQPPEEHPHARGPEHVGMEDMGPQQHSLGGGLDLEAAVGRARSPQPATSDAQPAPEADAMQAEAEKSNAGEPAKKDEEMRDAGSESDGGFLVVDADGNTTAERERKERDGEVENVPDASDATTL